jgi:hypothetical protein
MTRLVCLILALPALVLSNTASPAGVEQGAMAELALTSTTAHVNRFDVPLRAIFIQGSARYTFWGFYAGGVDGVHTWKIRFNLPSIGTWRYNTISADRHLHGKTGWVTVTSPAPGNRGMLTADGRALKWENTGERYYVMGQTAYGLLEAHIPWEQVMAWLQRHQFNQIRIDLTLSSTRGPKDMWLWAGTPSRPDFSRFNLAQWDKIDAVLQAGLKRGFTFEVGTTTIQQLPKAGPNRTRYLHYLAARLGAYPHLIYREDFEILGKPVRQGVLPTERTVKSVGTDFSRAFRGYPHAPLLGVHTRRNDTYHQGSTGPTFYHQGSEGLPADFRGQRWLTCGILHERWMMEGFGILQHRPHFTIPMYISEAVYEDTNQTVTHGIMHELDAFGMHDEIVHDPRFYYRRYTYSVILSGGVGMTYGLTGASVYKDKRGSYLSRWDTGIPPSQDRRNGAEGFKDIKRALDYFRAKGLEINQLQPDDTRINNGFSLPNSDELARDLGLKRAKFAQLAGAHTYYIYNPYHTHLTISGIPAGLSIEIFNPQTGDTYHGGQTHGGTVFSKPSQFVGDYLLYITERATPQ